LVFYLGNQEVSRNLPNQGDPTGINRLWGVVAQVVAVSCVNAELVDDFEVVFAPVLEIDQCVMERRSVVLLE
jgi:hypothetical protein